MKYLFNTLLLFFLSLSLASSRHFNKHRIIMEQKVIQLAYAYQNAYAQRCSSPTISCNTTSFHLCQGSGKKHCIDSFPLKSDCIGHGAFLAQSSGFRYPNSYDVKKLDQRQIQFVCTSAQLQNVFQEVSKGRDADFTFAYIADIDGGIRIYPSSIDAAAYGCKDFDARMRPWYKKATSPEKDIVIVLDRSKYMSNGKLEEGVVAAKAIIQTLSEKDYFSVILFDTYAEALLSDNLKKAEIKNTQNYRYNLDYILPRRRGANLQNAFNHAFKSLKKSGTNCVERQKIIFLITSGKISDGKTGESLVEHIQSLNTIDAKIFFFQDDNLEGSVFQQIACSNGGIAFRKQKSQMMESQVLTNIQGFYEYLVYQIPTDAEVIWTLPYADAFGYGELVTVAKPIFYEQNGFRRFIGVAAFDFKYEVLKNNWYSHRWLRKRLNANRYCYKTELPACQIENFRPLQCGLSQPCTDSYDVDNCTTNFPSKFIRNPETVQPKQCCFLSISELMAIIFGFSVMVFIIGLIFWWRRKKNLKKLKKYHKKLQKLKNKRLLQQQVLKQMQKKKLEQQQEMSEVQVINLSQSNELKGKKQEQQKNDQI